MQLELATDWYTVSSCNCSSLWLNCVDSQKQKEPQLSVGVWVLRCIKEYNSSDT